jgi:lipid-A-disaccharide synthase-like uncharacterized protein
VQWLASEKAGRSIIPVAFWYFGIAEGMVLLAYALHRRDVVFVIGQAGGLFIYVRNLYLLKHPRQPR